MDKKLNKQFLTLIDSIGDRVQHVVIKGQYTKPIRGTLPQKEFRIFYNGCLSDASQLETFDGIIEAMLPSKDKHEYKKKCEFASSATVTVLTAIQKGLNLGILSLTDNVLQGEIDKYTVLADKFQEDKQAIMEIMVQEKVAVRAKVAAKLADDDADDEDDDDTDGTMRHEPTDMSEKLKGLGLLPSFGSGSQKNIKDNLLLHLKGMPKFTPLKGRLVIDFRDESILAPRVQTANDFLGDKKKFSGGFIEHMKTKLLPEMPDLTSFETWVDSKKNPEIDKIDTFKRECLRYVTTHFGDILKHLQDNYLFFKSQGVHLSKVRQFFEEFQTRALNGFSLNFLEEFDDLFTNLQSALIYLTDDEFQTHRQQTNSTHFAPNRDGGYTAVLFGKEISIYQANKQVIKQNPNFHDVKRMLLAYPKRQTEHIKNKSYYFLGEACNKTWPNVAGAKVVTHIGPDDSPDGNVVTDVYNGGPLAISKKAKPLQTTLGAVFMDKNRYEEIQKKLNQEHIVEVAAVIVSLFFKKGRKKGKKVEPFNGSDKFLHYIALIMHNLQMITEKANQAVNSEHFSSALGKLAYMIYAFLIRFKGKIPNQDDSFQQRFAIILGKLMAMEEIAITDAHKDLLRQNIENLRNITEGITNLAQYVFFLPEGTYFERINLSGHLKVQPSSAFVKLQKDYNDLCKVLDVNKELIAELSKIIETNRVELAKAKNAFAKPPPAPASASAPASATTSPAAPAAAADAPAAAPDAPASAPDAPDAPSPTPPAARQKLDSAQAAFNASNKAAATAYATARLGIITEAQRITDDVKQPELDKAMSGLRAALKAADSAAAKAATAAKAAAATPTKSPKKASMFGRSPAKDEPDRVGVDSPQVTASLKSFRDALNTLDVSYSASKRKFLVALDVAEHAAHVAAQAARAIADEEPSDAAHSAAAVADAARAELDEASKTMRVASYDSITGRIDTPHDLVILQLANLYSTYQSSFKDFCKTMAMFHTASKDDDDLRSTHPKLADELVTLTFPPHEGQPRILWGLCVKYNLAETYMDFLGKVENLKRLIEVTRETNGFSELIRKARILMKSHDTVSMTELIDAVQVLTESDQYNGNDDLSVLTSRLADAEGDYADSLFAFFGLTDENALLSVKKQKYKFLAQLDVNDLSVQSIIVNGPTVTGSTQASKAVPVTPVHVTKLRDIPTPRFSPDTPAEYLNGLPLLSFEISEVNLMLGNKTDDTVAAYDRLSSEQFTERISAHPTMVKLKKDKEGLAKTPDVPTTAADTIEAAICSGLFERTEAYGNLHKRTTKKEKANTTAFYEEAKKTFEVPEFVGIKRDATGDTEFLTSKLHNQLRTLPDVATHFKDTLRKNKPSEPAAYSGVPVSPGPLRAHTSPDPPRVRPARNSLFSLFQSRSPTSERKGFFSRFFSSAPQQQEVSATPDGSEEKKEEDFSRRNIAHDLNSPVVNKEFVNFRRGAAQNSPEGQGTRMGGAAGTPTTPLLRPESLSDTDPAVESIQDEKRISTVSDSELSKESLEKVDAYDLYDLYIYFLENGIEPGVRKEIKDILFYHGIYCPSESKDAVDLKELVEKVKGLDHNDDFKCEKCCHTVFGMGFYELFYSLSNGSPTIPFGCHPYLLDEPMNRNTFLHIFGVSRYLHVAFPRSARMELYFMTLCSAFGRDYWVCKRPDYDIEADMIQPMFFTTFYELSGDPEYYEVNLTPEEFLESNGIKFAEKKRGEMVRLMMFIKRNKSRIDTEVEQKKFKEAESNLKEFKKDAQIEIRRAKRVQEKADSAGIDLTQDTLFTDEDSEEMTKAKKQVIVFKLYAIETIFRKKQAMRQFIDNALTMIECSATPDETITMLLENVDDVPELKELLTVAMNEPTEVTEKEQGKSADKPLEQAEIGATEKEALAQTEEVRLNAEAEQNELNRQSQIEIRIPLLATLREAGRVKNLDLLKTTAKSLLQTFEKGKLNGTDMASLHPINDILQKHTEDDDIKSYIVKFESLKTAPPAGGKTLRKRAVYNKTRNKLNRKSRRNRYK